jgi:hypothetical protein
MIRKIPSEVVFIIPCKQLKEMKKNVRVYQEAIHRLETALELCPTIGATGKDHEYTAFFHYFVRNHDLFICEYDKEERLMFGLEIQNGNLYLSEWGNYRVSQIITTENVTIDLNFPMQTLQVALNPDNKPQP